MIGINRCKKLISADPPYAPKDLLQPRENPAKEVKILVAKAPAGDWAAHSPFIRHPAKEERAAMLWSESSGVSREPI
jgi:hypothetical protein